MNPRESKSGAGEIQFKIENDRNIIFTKVVCSSAEQKRHRVRAGLLLRPRLRPVERPEPHFRSGRKTHHQGSPRRFKKITFRFQRNNHRIRTDIFGQDLHDGGLRADSWRDTESRGRAVRVHRGEPGNGRVRAEGVDDGDIQRRDQRPAGHQQQEPEDPVREARGGERSSRRPTSRT